MKLDRGQPPLFMAYWLWAAVYLFVVVADAVAAGPGVPLNFALCMPAALAAVPGSCCWRGVALSSWLSSWLYRGLYRRPRHGIPD